jgi:hypothetical protein
MEVLFGLVLTLTATVVGVWHIASRDRPLHGPIDDGTLGLPHLQRWSDSQKKRRFARAREALPLVDSGRLVLAGILIVVTVALVAGGFVILDRVAGSGSVDPASRLGEIVTLHARANASSDQATRYALLEDARTAVEEVLATAQGDDVVAVEAELQAIQDDLDRMTSMVRIDSVQPLGRIPLAGDAPAKLFHGGGKTYLLSDALYVVDVTTNELIRLLQPGDDVDGATVGALVGGIWRGDGPLVLDSARAYLYDHARGDWSWENLGEDTEGALPSAVQAVGVFDLNLYVLDSANGRILKYSGGDYEAKPEEWLSSEAAEELKQVRDIVVDGNIYALFPDGSVLRLFLNQIDALLEPNIQPAFNSAAALVPASDGFFVVNQEDGRIARISSDGRLIEQYQSIDEDIVLEGLQDVVVDESTGIALLLTGDSLYTTRLVRADG